jgi:hypothetical protein
MDGMNCNELVECVTDYLEGALGADGVAVEGHLLYCKPCQSYVDEVLVVLRVMSSLPTERLSPALEANLLAGFRR